MEILKLLASSSFLTVNKELIQLLGLEEAILFAELSSEYEYWKKKEELEDGYFYSTIENIEEKTTLTAHKQRKAINNLQDNYLIEVKIKGIPAKRYIKINEEQVINFFHNKMLKILTSSCEKKSQLDVKKMNGNNNIYNNNINNNIKECYEDNIGMITPAVAEKLFSYVDDGLSEELICQSIKIATLKNKRSMNYINGILRSWNNKGYKVLADIQEEKKQPKQETEEEKINRRIKEMEELIPND